jgi:hypothetical protein
MKHHTVKNLPNAESITEEIHKSPSRATTNSTHFNHRNYTKDAVNTVRRENRIYELCAGGGEDCLERIKHELDKDPKKHIRDVKDPNHLINRRGWQKQTPLYVATKHGNFEIVKHLLERGADPLYVSEIGKGAEESNLAVAVRWSQIKILKLLLTEIEWPRDQFL